MGLFHSHPNQPSDKELQLQSQLRQAAAGYEPMVVAGLQRLTRWALPDDQIERVDDAASGYVWQLWHTRQDGSKFVDLTVRVYFEDRRADKPALFQAVLKTPAGISHAIDGQLSPEDLDFALRRCVASFH